MNDLYDTLGVKKDATEQEIKDAYRTLAKDAHPDKQTGSVEKFQSLQLAYSTLSNKDKRDHYDKTGATSKPNFDAVLASFINGVVEEVINSGKQVDIIDLLKKVAEANLSQLDSQYHGLTDRRRKIEALADTFKIKKGTDYIAPIFSDKIRMIDQQQASLETEKKTLQDIYEVICGYEYDYVPGFVNPISGHSYQHLGFM